jgi:chemotaxis protein CheD
MNRYFDRTFESEAIKILPGEYFVTTGDLVLVTVLGSCVAACIRDPERRIGGINHFMLPAGNARDPLAASARCGVYAMEILINHLLKLGARRGSLEAKVFGSGRVMAELTQSQVGDRNAQFALEFLRTERIQVAGQDLLDVYPRKVYYFPATGRVLVKKLTRLANDTLIQREREYAARLNLEPVAGDVELFS